MALTKKQEMARLRKQNERLMKMIAEEREKGVGYEQVAKVHSAYIAILLKRLGATKENPVEIQPQEIAEMIKNHEARAFITERGAYCLYYEE